MIDVVDVPGDGLDHRLAEVAQSIRAEGGVAEAVTTDMRDETQVERLIDAAVARHGRLVLPASASAAKALARPSRAFEPSTSR